MKKILLLLVSAVFALTAYAQENGNGNDKWERQHSHCT